jgi:hypothetical protein
MLTPSRIDYLDSALWYLENHQKVALESCVITL